MILHPQFHSVRLETPSVSEGMLPLILEIKMNPTSDVLFSRDQAMGVAGTIRVGWVD
jgi:hypothetical protein